MALRFSLAAHTTYVCDRVVELRLAKIFCAGGGGEVLDISLRGEVLRCPSYPDPVKDKHR